MVVPVMLLPVFSPHLSKAFSTNNSAMLRQDMGLQTVIAGVSVIPLAMLLLTFPKEIMGFLFGEDYKASSPILSLIVFSQVLFALSLPWSNFLLMINKEHIYGFLHLLVVCLVLPLAIILAADWGAFAVAIASLIANSILFAFFTLTGITHLIFTQNQAS
jgi:O-antigen/teichoic acid export membrane protein